MTDLGTKKKKKKKKRKRKPSPRWSYSWFIIEGFWFFLWRECIRGTYVWLTTPLLSMANLEVSFRLLEDFDKAIHYHSMFYPWDWLHEQNALDGRTKRADTRLPYWFVPTIGISSISNFQMIQFSYPLQSNHILLISSELFMSLRIHQIWY